MRRLAIGAATLAVLAGGGTGAWLALRPAAGVAVGGPLAPTSEFAFLATGTAADVGEPLTYGLLVLKGVDSQPMELERVELARVDGGVRMVGSYVQPTSVGRGIALAYGYPPPRPGPDRHPVAGYRLVPHATLRVLVGFEATRPGHHAFHALRLYYRARGHRYRTDYPLAARVCAPKARWLGHCEPPND